MALGQPVTLCETTAVSSETLEKTLFPGTLTTTLPTQPGAVANLLQSADTVGGVYRATQAGAVLMSFAGVGSEGHTFTARIGQTNSSGTWTTPLGTVTVTLGSVSVTALNPFTGVVSASNWRPVKGVVIDEDLGNLGQLLADVDDPAANTPTRLAVDTSEGTYLYVALTSDSNGDQFLVVLTPVS